MIDELALKKSLQNGQTELLIKAIQTDLGPKLWARLNDMLQRADRSYELEDLIQDCCVYVLTTNAFLIHLRNSESPIHYLTASLSRMVFNKVSGHDQRKYYRKKLEKCLSDHSGKYVRVRPKLFSPREFSLNSTFSNGANMLKQSLTEVSSFKAEIRNEEMLAFLDHVFAFTKAPVHIDDLWNVFKLRFGIEAVEAVGLDDLIDYLPKDGEMDGESLESIVDGEGSLQESEVLSITRAFLSNLDTRSFDAFHCFALEFQRVQEIHNFAEKKLDWERIRKCMRAASDQTARNRTYALSNSTLKRLWKELYAEGFGQTDFALSLELAVYLTLKKERTV